MRAIDIFKKPYRECEAFARHANENLNARIERQRIFMHRGMYTEMQFNLISEDINQRRSRISELIGRIESAKFSDSNLYICSLEKKQQPL